MKRRFRAPLVVGPVSLVTIALLAAVPVVSGEGKEFHAGSGNYVALGDSVAAGGGASSPSKSYVGRLFSHYRSALGVNLLYNRAQYGETSGSIRGWQLDRARADINAASDTRAVTIDIGGNDVPTCAGNWASCGFRQNFAATLSELKAALDADPGQERFVAMAYYNPASGLGGSAPGTGESWYDAQLLGSDLAISCQTSTGPAVGLNDVIFQEAGRYGAGVANAYPAFKRGGQGLMADQLHPNDAGHAAIADAFVRPSMRCAPSASAPETTITRSPRSRTRRHAARFGFRSSEPQSSFECKLDRSRFKPCGSPKTYRHLESGTHRFEVRGSDPAGKTDPTPASWRWRIKRP